MIHYHFVDTYTALDNNTQDHTHTSIITQQFLSYL